jgi:hypothetical protein
LSDVDYEFFVATDDESLLNLAKKHLIKMPIHYNATRSQNGNPIHCGSNGILSNKKKLGEEVLIEAILLSRSDFFIHTNSNVANAVCCFNPNIKNFFFDCRKEYSYCNEPWEFEARI